MKTQWIEIPERFQFLSRDALKIIAVLTMVIDHIGVCFCADGTTAYLITRLIIGRIAFPIFCILFVQGMMYTKHPIRHIVTLAIFTVISEPCFDLVFRNTLLEWTYQSVMLTWLLACITILCLRKLHDCYEKKQVDKPMYMLGSASVILLISLLSFGLQTDYSFTSIVICGLVYLFWLRKPTLQLWIPGSLVALGVAASYMTPGALLAIPFMMVYNDKKRTTSNVVSRYGFYVFYPAHLLILYFLSAYVLS